MYRKWIHLLGPRGERIQVQAVIDRGAMKNTMCATKWQTQRHRLSRLHLSKVTLCVADNRRITSKGTWTGTIDMAGTETTQSCEVFDSNGAFQVILGKPWLCSVQAIHKYDTDEITIQVQGQTMTITNEEDTDPRERKEEMEQQKMKRGTQSEPTVTVHHVKLEPQQTKDDRTANPGDRANRASQRARDPANPERMQAILQKISIGTDITDDEWTTVIDLIKEYPDIFALNLSKVFPVDFTTHKLKLDPDIVLPRKVHQ